MGFYGVIVFLILSMITYLVGFFKCMSKYMKKATKSKIEKSSAIQKMMESPFVEGMIFKEVRDKKEEKTVLTITMVRIQCWRNFTRYLICFMLSMALNLDTR